MGGGQARQRSSSAIFSKSIFLSSYICTENAFYTSWEVKISLGSSKLIKCKFSKVYFWAPLWRENILDILGGKNQFRITKGYQMEIFKKLNEWSEMKCVCVWGGGKFAKGHQVCLELYLMLWKIFRHRQIIESSEGHKRSSSVNLSKCPDLDLKPPW